MAAHPSPAERDEVPTPPSNAGEDESPLWSPGGRHVAYAATRGAARLTLQRAADGSGDEQPPSAGVSPDSMRFLMLEGEPRAGMDRIVLVQHWDHELTRRVPHRR